MKKMLFLALAVIGGCFMVTFQASALSVGDSMRRFDESGPRLIGDESGPRLIGDVSDPRRLQPGETFLACYASFGIGTEQVKSILGFLNLRLNGMEINVYPYTLVGTDQNDDGSYNSTERKGEPVIVREPYRVEYMQPTFANDMPLFCAVIRKI